MASTVTAHRLLIELITSKIELAENLIHGKNYANHNNVWYN